RENRIYEITVASSEHLELLAAFPRPQGISALKLPLDSEGLLAAPAMPPVDEIGLIDGVFVDPRQIEHLQFLRSFGAPHAYKVFIMSAEFHRTWRATDRAAPGPGELFRGVLQYWSNRKFYLV